MVKTVNWNGQNLHTIEWSVKNEVEWYFIGREIVEVLGYQLNGKQAAIGYIRKYCNDNEFISVRNKEFKENLSEDEYKSLKIGRKGDQLINDKAVIKLIISCPLIDEIKKENILKILFPENNMIFIKSREEINFFDNLDECFKRAFHSNKSGENLSNDFIGIRQYQVDNYRIDYYLPLIKIAIEYDEDQHKYKIEEDEVRQSYLENKLGCKFIRIEDDGNSAVGLALLFNTIMEIYYEALCL